ncbi:hypothetical protein VL4N_03740 [Vagococcus lutrae]|nr:hypothetical protein VL2N_04680 [Vagococcus lutrae]GEQ63037.1 hypothetical protein VL3N_04790 [Vagococcus lutrae]GEQ64824.1 hypothetical protein VL4N_03740 [Vagococcus lutrae]
MEIDPVKLNSEHFQIHVTEGSNIKQGVKLATINLKGLNNANKDNDLIVVFPPDNNHSFNIQMNKNDQVKQNEIIDQLK